MHDFTILTLSCHYLTEVKTSGTMRCHSKSELILLLRKNHSIDFAICPFKTRQQLFCLFLIPYLRRIHVI